MRRRDIRCWAWLTGIALLALTVGCGPDGGDAADAADTGADAGSGPETGTPDGGYTCTYFPDSCGERKNCYPDGGDRGIRRSCRDYNADKSTGDSCQRMTDCNAGDRCIEGTCREMCDPDADDGCGTEAICLGLNVDGESLAFGVCVPKGDKCTTWPNDDCGEGKNCYKLAQGNRCLAYDADAQAGDACEEQQDCNAGQACIDAEDEPEAYCRDKCDDDHPCDSGECRDLSGVSYDACIPSDSG